jgi:hypothetical protein
VHNRFALWQGGLVMLADAPSGVGTGNSGRVFMDWYQPLTAKEGYRTMVNSYLTFATEEGVWVFGACLAALAVLWLVVTMESPSAVVARGSLSAFLVAGFFSTTMESPVLWLPPLAAVSLLAWVFWRNEKDWRLVRRRTLAGMSGATLTVLLIYLAGCYWGSRDDVARRFHFKGGELLSVELRQKAAVRTKSMAVWVDHEVLGTDYGKPLREVLARGLASEVEVFDAANGESFQAEVLIFCGARLGLFKLNDHQQAVLIMPPSARLENLAVDSSALPRLKIVTSNRILERSSSKVLEKLNGTGRVLALGGVEKNVLWYWDEILDWLTTDEH